MKLYWSILLQYKVAINFHFFILIAVAEVMQLSFQVELGKAIVSLSSPMERIACLCIYSYSASRSSELPEKSQHTSQLPFMLITWTFAFNPFLSREGFSSFSVIWGASRMQLCHGASEELLEGLWMLPWFWLSRNIQKEQVGLWRWWLVGRIRLITV